MGRQLGISVFALAAVALGLSLWWTHRPVPAYATGKGHFYVEETSYDFTPSRMTWHVGERVSVTIANEDEASPPKNHMWMLGKGELWEKPTPFGHPLLTGGFHVDFFEGVTVTVSHARAMKRLFHPNNPVVGPDAGDEFVKPFKKVVNGPPLHKQPPDLGVITEGGRGTVTLSFTVPDKPGAWQYGCFEQTSQHYLQGMRGTVQVVE